MSPILSMPCAISRETKSGFLVAQMRARVTPVCRGVASAREAVAAVAATGTAPGAGAARAVCTGAF